MMKWVFAVGFGSMGFVSLFCMFAAIAQGEWVYLAVFTGMLCFSFTEFDKHMKQWREGKL